MKDKSKIKQLREQRGLSLKKVAKELGVSHVAIIKWESGENFPKKNHLLNYAKILGCPITDFF